MNRFFTLAVILFILIFAVLAGFEILSIHNSIHNCQAVELIKTGVRAELSHDVANILHSVKGDTSKLTPDQLRALQLEKHLISTLQTDRCAGWLN